MTQDIRNDRSAHGPAEGPAGPTVVPTPGALSAHVGTTLGRTRWLTVEQEAVNSFASVTRDEQWIHVDQARAADGPFATTIAHGFFVLSHVSHFVAEVLSVTGARLAINYGLDRVRFTAPVAVGSQIRGVVVLEGVESVAGGVQARLAVTVERRDEVKPACVAEQIVRFLE
jgi:acyl dehydratase